MVPPKFYQLWTDQWPLKLCNKKEDLHHVEFLHAQAHYFKLENMYTISYNMYLVAFSWKYQTFSKNIFLQHQFLIPNTHVTWHMPL